MIVLGNYVAETRQELGSSIVKDFGLELNANDDPNIGRVIKFKEPTCILEQYEYKIIGKQMAYGYDNEGNYRMIPAYRGVPINIEDSFGRPFHLYQVEFVDEI